jgi:hypothetical protein
MSNKDGDSHTTPRETLSILCHQDYNFCNFSAGIFFDIELVKAESFADNICSVAYVADHVADNISLMIDPRKCRHDPPPPPRLDKVRSNSLRPWS